MADIVNIEKFKYVLDWYDVEDVEIDLDEFYCFEMQFRCGYWYLLYHVLEKGKLRHVYEHDFNLNQPKEAVRVLGKKLTKFSSLHGGGEAFLKHLVGILPKKVEELTEGKVRGQDAIKKLADEKKEILFKLLSEKPEISIREIMSRLNVGRKNAEKWRNEWKESRQ
jgi:hypothetical protein